MLHFPRWKIALILLVVLAGLHRRRSRTSSPRRRVASWPNWLPKQQMVLGLDLQGGAYLLYEVDRTDYVEKRLRSAGQRRPQGACSQSPRIGYTGLGVQRAGASSSASATSTQLDDARKRLEALRNPLDSSLLGGSAVNEFDLTVGDDGLVRFTYSQAGLDAARPRHRRSSRSRSSTAASTSSARPSRASSARATTASWSRRRASAIRSA